MRTVKPTANTKCIYCGELIGEEEYHWSKTRGYSPVFVHKRCWESIRPKKGAKTDEQQKNR